MNKKIENFRKNRMSAGFAFNSAPVVTKLSKSEIKKLKQKIN